MALPYRIDEEGRIFREKDGQSVHLATYREGLLAYQNTEAKKFHPAVKRFLNEQKVDVSQVSEPKIPVAPPVVEAVATAVPMAEIPQTTTLGPTVTAQMMKEASLDTLTVEQRKALVHLRREQGFPSEVETDAPKAPELGEAGDKTPEYVEWMLRYHPADFAVKYGLYGFGTQIEKQMVFNPETRMMESKKVEVRGVTSRRKTHLTIIDPKKSGVSRA